MTLGLGAGNAIRARGLVIVDLHADKAGIGAFLSRRAILEANSLFVGVQGADKSLRTAPTGAFPEAGIDVAGF